MTRIIAVGLVWNARNQLLFCRMHPKHGVFPGEWGFPGGGLEPDEPMREALRRELREEIGIEVEQIRPAFFKDGQHTKTLRDGRQAAIYMIFLVFHCRARSEDLVLNDELVEYRWMEESAVDELELNRETVDTLQQLGDWQRV